MLLRYAANEHEQERLGGQLAKACPAVCVIYLQGDLGAGKTTLVRGFLRQLGHQGHVKSPTYTLIEPYHLAGGSCYHLDLYRLTDPEELEYLGIRDFLGRSVLLIEWPERGRGQLPLPDIEVMISPEGGGRTLQFWGRSSVGRKIIQLLQ